MKIKTKVIIGIVVVGLFVGDVTIFSKIGANIKAEKEAQAQEEYKARDWQNKLGFAEICGRILAEDKAEKQAELQKNLEEDFKKHKNDKPVGANKPMTQEEKEDLNKG